MTRNGLHQFLNEAGCLLRIVDHLGCRHTVALSINTDDANTDIGDAVRPSSEKRVKSPDQSKPDQLSGSVFTSSTGRFLVYTPSDNWRKTADSQGAGLQVNRLFSVERQVF